MGNFIKYYLNEFFNSKSKEKSLEEIKNRFRQYGCGTVDLTLGEDGIGYLALNNPDKRNALTGKMMVELSEAVSQLEEWTGGRGVLIHGAGLGFCSGVDLDLVRSLPVPTLPQDMSRLMTDALDRLRALPILSLVYVHGFGAIGGGSELALGGDLRVMSPGSRIGFVHSKMGLTPAWGAAHRLQEMVGREAALELLLTGRMVAAQEAKSLGLVSVLGDLTEAETYLRSLTMVPPSVISGVKTALRGPASSEAAVFLSLFGAEANQKALAAKIKHNT